MKYANPLGQTAAAATERAGRCATVAGAVRGSNLQTMHRYPGINALISSAGATAPFSGHSSCRALLRGVHWTRSGRGQPAITPRETTDFGPGHDLKHCI